MRFATVIVGAANVSLWPFLLPLLAAVVDKRLE
jgi:hypothetical protein